jgi:deazaflavin-dependent oxidoreductase (nitroreductase family)
MSSSGKPQQGIVDPAAVPVGPSRIVKLVISPMTKILNPVIDNLAGRRHFAMAGRIHHIGRRSGKSYVTSARILVKGDIALIPLTFGNQSDWARNIHAAGGCAIQTNGNSYRAARPEFLTAAAPLVRATCEPMERAGFKFLGIKQYLQLQLVLP